MGGDDSPSLEVAPADVSSYLEPSYWDKRFAKEEHYEWFKDYTHFRAFILEHIRNSDRVLEIGCGNSRMSESMYKDGITNITCSDLSSVAIEHLRERCAAQGYEEIVPVVASMLDLPFEDSSFDVVIEKGTMDLLFVNSGDPWNPKEEVKEQVRAMLSEAHRVLTPTGTFISIAFGQPHFRRPFFEAADFSWSMQWTTFGDSFHYFFYTLKKGTKISAPGPKFLCMENVESSQLNMEHEYMDDENYLFRSSLVDQDL